MPARQELDGLTRFWLAVDGLLCTLLVLIAACQLMGPARNHEEVARRFRVAAAAAPPPTHHGHRANSANCARTAAIPTTTTTTSAAATATCCGANAATARSPLGAQAAAAATEALEIRPGYPPALYRKSQAHLAAERYTDAVEDARAALRGAEYALSPEDATIGKLRRHAEVPPPS
jgi:hypothetical protein